MEVMANAGEKKKKKKTNAGESLKDKKVNPEALY